MSPAWLRAGRWGVKTWIESEAWRYRVLALPALPQNEEEGRSLRSCAFP